MKTSIAERAIAEKRPRICCSRRWHSSVKNSEREEENRTQLFGETDKHGQAVVDWKKWGRKKRLKWGCKIASKSVKASRIANALQGWDLCTGFLAVPHCSNAESVLLNTHLPLSSVLFMLSQHSRYSALHSFDRKSIKTAETQGNKTYEKKNEKRKREAVRNAGNQNGGSAGQ